MGCREPQPRGWPRGPSARAAPYAVQPRSPPRSPRAGTCGRCCNNNSALAPVFAGLPVPTKAIVSILAEQAAPPIGRLNQHAKRVAAEGCPGKALHLATIFSRSTQGRHFVRIFIIDRVFVAADVFNLRVSGFDCHERLGQRLEIAGILEPTVPYALVRPAQPPELGLVGFGNAVDVGGDLNTWCADRRDSSRVISTR